VSPDAAESTAVQSRSERPWADASSKLEPIVVSAGERRPGCEDETRREQLKPARVQQERDQESEGERDPRTPTEGKEHRRDEHDRQRRRDAARDSAVGPRRESERQEHAHDGEDAEAVPVADRIAQSVSGDGVELGESIRQHAREEGVTRDERDTCEDSGYERDRRSTPDEEKRQE
jgi:hypothetical protein